MIYLLFLDFLTLVPETKVCCVEFDINIIGTILKYLLKNGYSCCRICRTEIFKKELKNVFDSFPSSSKVG